MKMEMKTNVVVKVASSERGNNRYSGELSKTMSNGSCAWFAAVRNRETTAVVEIYFV